VILEHRFILTRRSGKHDEKLAVIAEHHPYRGAERIWKNVCTADDIGLPLVDLRHLASPTPKAFTELRLQFVVINQFASCGTCRDLSGDIILSRS